jgi:ribonuclease HIII
VAAASILAREKFIDWLRNARRSYGQDLPRGVSAQVKEAAHALVAAHGGEILTKVAKTHFKTAHEIAPEHYEKPPESAFRRFVRTKSGDSTSK